MHSIKKTWTVMKLKGKRVERNMTYCIRIPCAKLSIHTAASVSTQDGIIMFRKAHVYSFPSLENLLKAVLSRNSTNAGLFPASESGMINISYYL